MDFAPDPIVEDCAARVRAFLEEEIIPAEPVLEEQLRAHPVDADGWWPTPPIVDALRASAKRRGLWNLFLSAPEGAGLTNLQYAPLAELMGRSPKLAPVAMNCAAPDSGNIEMLRDFATPEQKQQWLEPLLDGRIRSAFAMTEPAVASSDATNIRTSIRRDGDDYVIDGEKWFISGALGDRCEIFIVMGQTDPEAPKHRRQSMVLVPRDTPGVTVGEGLTILGYDDHDHGGHARVSFDGVRVPVTNVLKGEGEGFAIAQARLGPGRIHHCMRLLGMGERTYELMLSRARERSTFGRPLSDHGIVQAWLAEARITLDSMRLLVLHAAYRMDVGGNKLAHTDIQQIKIAVPRAIQKLLDDAMQLFGAAGLTAEQPIAEFFAFARALRFADGPDEVHLTSLGRALLKR